MKFRKSLALLTLASLLITPLTQAKETTPGYTQKIPAKLMTPDKVQTRIGELDFYDGMPSDGTIKKLYDNYIKTIVR